LNTMRHHFVLLGLLAVGACRGLPSVDVIPSVSTSPALAAVNPMEVAILPVDDNTVNEAASWLLSDMRRAAQEALVDRLYSSMGLGHVDTRLASQAAGWSIRDQASLSRLCGQFQEDAILAITVNAWDDADIMSAARVRFSLEAALVGGEEKQVLWTGRVEGSIKAGGDGPAPFDRQDRARDIARRAVAQLIGLLDARR